MITRLLFFWVLTFWAAARFLTSDNGRWFYVMGASVGLAIQSKYTGILLFRFFSFSFFGAANIAHGS